MRISPYVEMVVASFDDPIVTGLRVEQEAERAAATGATGTTGPPVSDAGVVFVVARHAYVLVGCAGLRRTGDDVAEIQQVYVRPEYREPEISRLLLAGVEELARRRGFAVLHLGPGDPGDAEPYSSGGYTLRGAGYEKSLCALPPRETA